MSNLGNFGSLAFDTAEAALPPTTGGWLKAQQGENNIRVLPPKPGKQAPVLVWRHKVDVPGRQYPVSWTCPMKLNGDSCPECDKADELDASGNKEDQKLAYGHRPKLRAFFNVLHMEDPGGPKIWEVSAHPKKGFYNKIKKIYNSKRGGDFTHPETGFNLILERDGEGRGTTYDLSADKDSTGPIDADPEKAEQLIMAQADLENFLKVVPYDSLFEDDTPQTRDESSQDAIANMS